MIRKRLSRFGTVFSAATIALMLVGVGGATASTPGWAMQVVSAPQATCATGIDFCATVSPSAYMKFTVTITNNGKSNIAKLFLTDTNPATPASVSPSAGCSTNGELLCALGALSSGKSVTRTIIYQLPSSGSSFDFNFEANTSGVSGSDGGTSHGDTLRKRGHIVLDGSTDFKGGYLLGTGDLQTGGAGGQDTKLTPPESGIGVTIREVSGTTNVCGTGTPFGQLVQLNISDGKLYSTPFKTVITVATSGLPDELELRQVKLCHQLDSGEVKTLGRCSADAAPDPAPTGVACFWPKWAGTHTPDREQHGEQDADDWTSLVLDIWDFQNGNIRGGY